MQTHVCSVPRDICTILLLFLLACIKSSCDAHALYRWDSHNERTNIENSDASKLDRPRTFDTDDFTDKQMSLSAGEYWGSTDQNGVYRRDGIPWRDKNTEDYSLPPRSKKQDILEEYDDNGNQDSVISYFGSHEIKSDESGSPKSRVPLFGNHVKEGEVDQKAMESLEHLKVVQDADREVTDMVNSVIDTDANMAGMLNAGGTGGALGGIPVDSTGKGFLEKNEDKDMDVTFDESEAGSSSQLDQPRRGNEDTLGKVEVIDNGNDEAMKGSLVSQSDQPRLEDEAKQDKVDRIDGGVKSLALKVGSLTTDTKQAADTFFDNEVGPNSTSQTILRIGKPGNVINKTSVAKHDSGDKTLGMRIDEQMAELLKKFAERENGTNDSTSVTDSPRSSTTDVDKAHGHNDSMNPTTPLVSGSPIIPTPKSNENALSAVNILASSGISMETGSSDKTSMTTGSSDRPSITTGSSDVTSAITGSSDVTSAITGSSGQVINFNEVGNVENDNLPTYKESKPLDWDLQNNKQLASDGNHGMSGSYGNANPMGDNVIGSSGAVIPSGVVDVNPIVDAPSKEERNETIDIVSSTITQPGDQADTNPIRAASSQHTKITVSEDLDNNNVTIPFSEESGDKVQEDLKKMTSNFLTVHPSSLPVLMEYFKNETALQKQLQNKLRTVSSDGSARATKKSFGEEVPGDPPKVTQRNSSNGENNKKEAMKQFVLRLLKMFSMVKSRLATLAKKQGRDSKKSYASETPTRKATVEINANFDNVADLLRKINVSEIFQEETAPERDMDVMALDSGGKNGTQLENGNVSSIGKIGKPTGSEAMKTKSNAGPLDSNAMKTESNTGQLDSNAMKTESNTVPLGSNAMKTKGNTIQVANNTIPTASDAANEKAKAAKLAEDLEKERRQRSDAMMYKKRLKSLEIALSQDFFNTWMYHYKSFEDMSIKPDKLRTGISTLGASDRLSRVILKALRGSTVNIMVVGGSISAGGGLERDRHNVQGIYYKAFMDWWGTTVTPITNSQININVIAIGGTDSEYFSYCIRNYIHENPDLILWELAANDYHRYTDRNMDPATPLEQLTRVLLSLTSSPALIFVNFFRGDYYRTTQGQDCPDSEDEGGKVIAEYYKITSLSWRNVICSEMRQQRRRAMPELTLKTLFSSDGYHPSLLGHAQTATLLISYIRGVFEEVVSQEMKRVDSGGFVNDGMQQTISNSLPNPIYNDPKTPKPLCWTLLTPDYHFKVDNELPGLRITEARGFEFVNVTRWPIRLDRLRCLKAIQPDARLQIKLNVPKREDVDGPLNRELSAITHNSYVGVARVWLDNRQWDSQVITEPKGQRRTQTHVISSSVKPGVHLITFQSVGTGFCLSALAVI